MQNIMKKTAAGAVMGGSLLFTGMGVAQAAPPQIQDGLVNVAVGDVTVLRNVQVEAVAQVLADVCPNVNVEDVNVLATAGGRGRWQPAGRQLHRLHAARQPAAERAGQWQCRQRTRSNPVTNR